MIFDAMETENDPEVWRVVNMNTTQRTHAELLVLEDAVSARRQRSNIKDIQRALLQRDAACRI